MKFKQNLKEHNKTRRDFLKSGSFLMAGYSFLPNSVLASTKNLTESQKSLNSDLIHYPDMPSDDILPNKVITV